VRSSPERERERERGGGEREGREEAETFLAILRNERKKKGQ